MKELVEFIAKSLVGDDAFIEVEENKEEKIVKLYVRKSDIGKIIGKQGRIINSIRTIMTSCFDSRTYKLYVEEKNS